MRKAIQLLLCLMSAAALLSGCAARAEQRTGEAQGYGGILRVSVSMNGTDVTEVRVLSHSETEGVGTRAIEQLPARIVETDGVNVDSVTGATVTSEAIKAAVAQAMGVAAASPETRPTDEPSSSPLRTGMGMAATGRIGPGTDENGNPVYSFNVVFACGSFDQEGRIASLKVDQLEVLSSQYSGFPTSADGEEEFLQQVSGWMTKGMKGEDYMLSSGSWRQQMNAYEKMMTGKTIEEVNAWFSANFSEENGKPRQNASEGNETSNGNAQTETITGATMSLRDVHGDILTAIQRAWEDAQRSSQPTPAGEGMIDTNTQTDMMDGDNSMG